MLKSAKKLNSSLLFAFTRKKYPASFSEFLYLLSHVFVFQCHVFLWWQI